MNYLFLSKRHSSIPLRLVIFLPPRIHKEGYPRKPQHNVSKNLPQPMMAEHFKLPLKVKPPNCHGNIKHHTPFGKEPVKLSVLNKCHHEQKKPNSKQKQPRKGIGGSNQQLIMRRWSSKITRGFDAMAKHKDLISVKDQHSSRSQSNHRMEQTNKEETRWCHWESNPEIDQAPSKWTKSQSKPKTKIEKQYPLKP